MRLRILTLALLLLFQMKETVAQDHINACLSPGATGKMWVLFVQPDISESIKRADPSLENFTRELQFHYLTWAESRQVESSYDELYFIGCISPAIMRPDYLLSEYARLNNLGVLLSVGTNISSVTSASRDVSTENGSNSTLLHNSVVGATINAQISYAPIPIISLREAGFATGKPLAVGAFYRQSIVAPHGKFIDTFKIDSDIDAFIFIAMGMRHRVERRLELAHSRLCLASMELKRILDRRSKHGHEDELNALLRLQTFVSNQAQKIIGDVAKAPRPEDFGRKLAYLAVTGTGCGSPVEHPSSESVSNPSFNPNTGISQ